MQVPVAVLVDRRPVTVRPDAREAPPVRLEVALVVAPDAAGHPGPRPRADELADLAAQRLPVRRVDVHRQAQRREAERDGLRRIQQADREEAGADLGAARDVDDRDPPAARDVLVQPVVGAGVPRLAGRRDRAQGGEIGVGLALRDQRADQGRRDPEHGHALLLDEPPEPVVRPVGRSLHVDHAGAERARADDRPRAHDPAHVGREEDAVAGPDVGLVGRLAGDREQEAAVDVQRPLRPAGRAGRVCEQVGVLRLDLERRQLAGPELHVPAPVVARPLDDVLDGRRLAQRLVDRLAHRHARSAAERVVGGDHGLRLRVLEALHDRGRGEAGEDRHLNGADVRAGVRGDRGRGRHRHVDRDAVARARCPAPTSASASSVDLARELGERQLVARSVLAAEDGGGRDRASVPPSRARMRSRCSAALPRTRSSTRSRASRRARGPTDVRARARDRRRRRARSGRARRSRPGAAPGRPSHPSARASRVRFAASSCSGDGVHAYFSDTSQVFTNVFRH